ncbi:MAG TPA: LysR family transcriptional regulator [Aliidongia sp.]|nr:LysR family transcriptional regulator [Aliidongia sp.]
MLDPILLRSFLAVARSRSFSEAGRGLGHGQPAISQHIRKLEAQIGRRLFVRDTHSVALTPDGEAMVAFAEHILDANERAERYFSGTQLRGRLSFGASEDFVFSGLSEVLRDFRRRHPLVDLELTVGLSGLLHAKLDDGELDLILAKRAEGEERGQLVWQDKLVWVGTSSLVVDQRQPLPLILYPPPSITRDQILQALERAGRSWRIACTSGGLTGLRAAALAELGVLALARELIPPGLVELPAILPELGDVTFVLRAGKGVRSAPAQQLSEAILEHGRKLLGREG